MKALKLLAEIINLQRMLDNGNHESNPKVIIRRTSGDVHEILKITNVTLSDDKCCTKGETCIVLDVEVEKPK